MLEYEWGSPSSIILAGEEPASDVDQSRQMFDHYHQSFNQTHFLPPSATPYSNNQAQLPSPYDPRAYGSTSYPQPQNPALLSVGGDGFIVVPKREDDFVNRIGLNLGGRTYFSSAEDDFVNRLYRRSRLAEPAFGNSARCQAEGCNADLNHAKHYHRRHKVCEFHSKAATVVAGGLTQRFCQQCSRFHLLSEFDNGKRSCRKRLADHNRRRRKSQQTVPENSKAHLENSSSSFSDNLERSPTDSGAYSSSVTVAVSPPKMSLDYFRQRPYQATTSSSSLFFSGG